MMKLSSEPYVADEDSQQPGVSRRPRAVISRREFLRRIGAAAAGLLVAGCAPRELSETPSDTSTEALTTAPKGAPTATPVDAPTGAPTDTPAGAPTAAATSPPSPPVSPGALSKVAIGRAQSYEPNLIRRQVQMLLDGIGGLSDVIGSGDRVAIKTNLTGGTYFQPPAGFTATESYLPHPEVIHALGESLRDAGAGELFIVEAVYDQESYSVFGHQDVAEALDATLIDLNGTEPYGDFASAAVGSGAFVYQDFVFNHILEEVDVFVSVAKMKCHFNAGVTLSMKNLVGLVPAASYRLAEDHWWRSALHGQIEETKSRLPRVIVDLNRARPIHLALIDGVKTGEGGEAPRGSFAPVQPGVLVAGKNPVATDAVATAVMGFDPTIEPPASPFLRGDNHLNLACQLGLGTNRLEEIEVVGASIDDVRYEFEPSWEM